MPYAMLLLPMPPRLMDAGAFGHVPACGSTHLRAQPTIPLEADLPKILTVPPGTWGLQFADWASVHAGASAMDAGDAPGTRHGVSATHRERPQCVAQVEHPADSVKFEKSATWVRRLVPSLGV